jgi:hypothetical protein
LPILQLQAHSTTDGMVPQHQFPSEPITPTGTSYDLIREVITYDLLSVNYSGMGTLDVRISDFVN